MDKKNSNISRISQPTEIRSTFWQRIAPFVREMPYGGIVTIAYPSHEFANRARNGLKATLREMSIKGVRTRIVMDKGIAKLKITKAKTEEAIVKEN